MTVNAKDNQIEQQLVDLQRLTAGIRWRRRLWTIMALVGLAAGIGVGAFLPLRATASARVYVVHASETSDEGPMKTDLALLQTTTVAAVAIDRLRLATTPEKFTTTYTGAVVTGNILEVTARGSDDADAIARTQAVADAFIAVHVRQADDSAKAEVSALTQLRDATQKDLDDVNDQIKTVGDADPTKQAALVDRRASLGSQVASLDQRAQEAGIGSPAVAAGTKIIDAAHATSKSILVSAGIYGAIGLLVGLGLGLVAAAVASVTRDRPVLRRDISAHLGASVIAQLPAPVRGPRRLVDRSRSVKERQSAAVTLARLVREDADAVSVLELGCPRLAAELAKDIAGEIAGERPVVVVDDLPGGQVTALADTMPERVTVVPGESFPASTPTDAETRVIAVGALGPGAPWTDLRRLGAEALVVVRAGSTEASWMHTVARQLADAGIAIIGLVIVHPDPRDRSDGTLWDALQTAVRGRVSARHAPSTAEAVAQAAALAAVQAVAGAVPVTAVAAPQPYVDPRFAPQFVRPPAAYPPVASVPPRMPMRRPVEALPTEAIAMGVPDERTRALPVTPRPAADGPKPAAATHGHPAFPPHGAEETVALPAQRQHRNGANGATNGKNGKVAPAAAPVDEASADVERRATGERDTPTTAGGARPQAEDVSAAHGSRGDEPSGRGRGRPAPRPRPRLRPVPHDGHPTVKFSPVVRSTPADRTEAS